jgi:hypothetical protein
MRTHTNRSSNRPSAAPSSAVAWIQEDGQGNRWVYYRLKSGEFSPGRQLTSAGADDRAAETNEEQLTSTRAAADAPRPNCIWTGYCWFCP